MTSKKRTSLDALGLGATVSSKGVPAKKSVGSQLPSNLVGDAQPGTFAEKGSEKAEIAKTTVYVPRVVFEQWRELAFTERKKMHDYLLEGLDRVFADRGLKSINELKGKE